MQVPVPGGEVQQGHQQGHVGAAARLCAGVSLACLGLPTCINLMLRGTEGISCQELAIQAMLQQSQLHAPADVMTARP